MAYFTTSREPKKPTKELGRALAARLGGLYEERGLKGIEDVVERARKKGQARAVIVHEQEGKPHSLNVIDLSREPWQWAGEVILENGKLGGALISTIKNLLRQ